MSNNVPLDLSFYLKCLLREPGNMPMCEEWCKMYVELFANQVLPNYTPVRKSSRKRRLRDFGPYVRH